MNQVSQTGMDRPPRLSDVRGTVLMVIAWLLMVIGISILLGCETQRTKLPTYADTITAAEELVITAAHTLTDAADAGVISRNSHTYQDLKELIIEASMMVRWAWEAYLNGDQHEAEQWRKGTLSLYAQIRPALVELAQEAPQ